VAAIPEKELEVLSEIPLLDPIDQTKLLSLYHVYAGDLPRLSREQLCRSMVARGISQHNTNALAKVLDTSNSRQISFFEFVRAYRVGAIPETSLDADRVNLVLRSLVNPVVDMQPLLDEKGKPFIQKSAIIDNMASRFDIPRNVGQLLLQCAAAASSTLMTSVEFVRGELHGIFPINKAQVCGNNHCQCKLGHLSIASFTGRMLIFP
jgi:hypothetical protein